MSQLSKSYVEKVVAWTNGGVAIERMHMSLDQKFRANLCLEAYRVFMNNPSIPVRTIVRNIAARDYKQLMDCADRGNEASIEMARALGVRRHPETGAISLRSETNISNDIWLVNQLLARLNTSKKHIHLAMVEANVEWLSEYGRQTGTWQAVKEANQEMFKLHNDFKDDEDPQEQMPNTNINITGDVGVVKEGRESLDDAAKEALRRKYGLTEKELAVQMEEINGVWQEPDPEEEKPDIFDENL
jgi:hypothetical protein